MRSKIYFTILTWVLIFCLSMSCSPAGQASAYLEANELLADPVQPTPHPILSDLRVRQAIAYCTNKDALVAAAYPELTLEERQALIMDTFIPETNWAYSEPSIIYNYDPAHGKALLEDAGWVEPAPGAYRLKDGNELYLQLNTSDTSLRLVFLPVFEAQMQACGIHVLRNHASATWLFGSWTGLQVRDFELIEFAWTAGEDPGGDSLYACNYIPSPENGWSGQNSMGWCNPEASEAIILASDTSLPLEDRAAYYAIVIDLLAEDIPTLPLFLRAGTTTWEHIDFNLETYAQDEVIPPEGTNQEGLIFTDYQGLEDSVTVPAGAVSDPTGLRYYPLVSNAQPTPDGLIMAKAFRLNAVLGGVPEDGFIFDEPLTLTVRYDLDALTNHYIESSMLLYAWDPVNSLWMDAAETCPLADRYSHLDTTNDLYQVNICHLSEFGLFLKGGDSIRMGVDYGYDEAAGMYDVGHTFYVRVSNSQGVVKATATVETEAGGAGTGTGELFAYSDGFWVQAEDWSNPNIDIVPGDRVYFESDDGFTETIVVGTIAAWFNPSTDSAWGVITAPVMPTEGSAGWWGWFWEVFTIAPDGSFFVYFADFDLYPGINTVVRYNEADSDAVGNSFKVPLYFVVLPLVVR